jgi:hypothetical protein
MPGKSSDSKLGQVVGALVAVLALGLWFLDGTTDMSVPYGYGGDAFLLGAAVAVIAIAVVGWKYRNVLSN